MIYDDLLDRRERLLLELRGLYRSFGYSPYRMSKFEEYDLYAGNKDFLVSDNVITFTDTDGKLMALKPDVTLSIIKNSPDLPEETRRVCYNENVYRVSKRTGFYGEIMQAGVECFGRVGGDEVREVLKLALSSLDLLGKETVLAVSDLGIVSELLGRTGLGGETRRKIYAALAGRNARELADLCKGSRDGAAAELLGKLLTLQGPAKEVLGELDTLLSGVAAYGPFREILAALPELWIDFSVTDDINYYNGLVFKGFVRDVPEAVLSGGQYDRLMRKLGRHGRAVGFAVYTDAMEHAPEETAPEDGFVNVALPKGRLGEQVYGMFAGAGYECPAVLEPGRKLIFENPEKGVRYFWVKPSDVAIYVERGAADIGVAGKDILLEYAPDVYELGDLGCGRCRMAVAAPRGFTDDPGRTLRVATKFGGIARDFYRGKGREIDIIRLNGSIEIAPILGLADVIVDIVETGTTLKENNLEVLETVVPVSARLIANKTSYKFKNGRIAAVAAALAEAAEEKP